MDELENKSLTGSVYDGDDDFLSSTCQLNLLVWTFLAGANWMCGCGHETLRQEGGARRHTFAAGYG